MQTHGILQLVDQGWYVLKCPSDCCDLSCEMTSSKGIYSTKTSVVILDACKMSSSMVPEQRQQASLDYMPAAEVTSLACRLLCCRSKPQQNMPVATA